MAIMCAPDNLEIRLLPPRFALPFEDEHETPLESSIDELRGMKGLESIALPPQ
jgi:hypothetical protein